MYRYRVLLRYRFFSASKMSVRQYRFSECVSPFSQTCISLKLQVQMHVKLKIFLPSQNPLLLSGGAYFSASGGVFFLKKTPPEAEKYAPPESKSDIYYSCAFTHFCIDYMGLIICPLPFVMEGHIRSFLGRTSAHGFAYLQPYRREPFTFLSPEVSVFY